MAEQYEHGWRDPRKMSRRELEDWAALHSTWPPTDRHIPEWTDWRPKLMVPRWVIIVMYGALLVTFALSGASVLAGEVTLSWTNPANGETCVDAGPIALNGVRIWQLVAEVNAPENDEYTIENLLPGDYTFGATAVDEDDAESRISGKAEKTVDSFIAVAGATVYQVVSITDGFWLLPVGTIATDTACDVSQSVNGRYTVPRSDVNFTGTTNPLVVVSDCG